MAAEGVSLVLNDLDDGPLAETLKRVEGMGSRAIGVSGSVTDASMAERLVGEATGRLGNLHMVATCAGFTWDVMFHRMTDEQWQAMVDVHLTGTMRVVRESFKAMRERAQAEQEQGSTPVARKVITVSSMSSFGNLGQANYSAAKAGIVGLTRTVALEGARFNILANSVAFGPMDTRLTRPRESQEERVGDSVLGMPAEARESYLSGIPLGRVGTIDEAVGPLLFLASDHANYISGALLEVNGAAHIS
jgi:3-oxoacyl-[acyl-carrier protein] reductase